MPEVYVLEMAWSPHGDNNEAVGVYSSEELAREELQKIGRIPPKGELWAEQRANDGSLWGCVDIWEGNDYYPHYFRIVRLEIDAPSARRENA